ncbi:MAG TPA: HD-GYP domain-containing protein [Sporichthyaceae bacterium]|nr:HD-GYP domain-containing protein [Sporichthyaceae bacterium]
MGLSPLPRRAHGYIAAVVLSAALVAGLALRHPPDPATLATVGALYAVLDPLSTVPLARGVTVSAGFPVCLAAVVLLGPGGGALVGLAGAAWQPGRPPLAKRLFNAATPALCAAAAGTAYQSLGGTSPLTAADFPGILPVFAAAALVYAVGNAALLAGALHLAEGVRFRDALRSTLSSGIGGYLLYGLFGLLMAVLWSADLGAFAAVLVLLPLLVARWALRQYAAERAAYERTVTALIRAVETKDRYTRGHSERVARGAELIGRQIGLADGELRSLRFAGLLHDLGKLGVPIALLNSSGGLSEAEYAELARHPEQGVAMIRDIPFLRDAAAGVRHHHERFDGFGYPAGLKGAEIPQFARAIAVADAFDAMTTTRSYRPARTPEQAMTELRTGAGRQFDPVMVEAFAGAVVEHGWEAPLPVGLPGPDTCFDHDDPAATASGGAVPVAGTTGSGRSARALRPAHSPTAGASGDEPHSV